MKVGDRVRVKESVVVYHHPKHRNEAFDLQGQEGEVANIASEWKGQAISANLPVMVKFDKRFKAHFREDEIEAI
ncbi:MAG: ferredoxin-thioredoxin reductase variable chain [Elainellaceae cyanobacterium]